MRKEYFFIAILVLALVITVTSSIMPMGTRLVMVLAFSGSIYVLVQQVLANRK